jgi:hypothetical protein
VVYSPYLRILGEIWGVSVRFITLNLPFLCKII